MSPRWGSTPRLTGRLTVGRNVTLTLTDRLANRNLIAVFHFLPLSDIIRNLGKPIALLATYFHAGFLRGLFFDPEDGGDMFLRNVC
jgi:hypothetical protein